MRLYAVILASSVLSIADEVQACDIVIVESFYAFGGQGHLDGHALGNEEPPDLLRDVPVTVRGRGRLAGGGMQLHLLLFDRMRLGYDVIAWDIGDAELEAALPPGMSFDVRHFVGLRDDLFVGVELLQGPVYPYLDLVGSGDIVFADVALQDPLLGKVDSALYGDVSLAIGARAGLRVPITSVLMLDVAGQHRIFGGHVNFSGTAGLTVTLGSRTDPYAQKLEERDDT
ncbi:MAG TPA: hypothetical protein VFB62_01100 [Polyangiaceae bacterium]|jgi:hypothetical protein|nr:hypothetical protein [Polyangiaceae bacterium]